MTATVERSRAALWVAGARPRTLPAAVAPVLVGTGTAAFAGSARWGLAALALLVSLALQVGVNFANDYSDGIRGTDADRVGPLRLVGSGSASPGAVKRAALAALGVAALAGLVLVLLSGQWWLLVVGAAAVAAAWFYTGGRRPYGYAGLGEVSVFVFFGLVAVGGTTLVQTGRVDAATGVGAVVIGCLASALLVANNLRDIVGDRASGKRTLATRLGDRRTRVLYAALVAVAVLGVVVIAGLTTWWALLGLALLATGVPAVRTTLRGALGGDLIPVLQRTGSTELLAAVGLFLGLLLG